MYIVQWDGKRKPVWDTIRAEPLPNEDGETLNIACFDTEPFKTVDEYYRYFNAAEAFVQRHGRRPLTIADFLALKELVEEK